MKHPKHQSCVFCLIVQDPNIFHREQFEIQIQSIFHQALINLLCLPSMSVLIDCDTGAVYYLFLGVACVLYCHASSHMLSGLTVKICILSRDTAEI